MEFDGDLQLHGDRLAVQFRRLVLPAAKCVEGRLAKEHWAGHNVHADNVAILVDGGFDDYVAFHA